MKQIPLSQGKFALVDDDDFEYLSQWKWYFTNHGYAARNVKLPSGKRTGVLMHRILLEAKSGQEIDHMNYNKIDNQKSNLRPCSRMQNQHNLPRKSDNTSGYKGVYFSKHNNKWISQIRINGKRRHIGCHKSAEDAATAYNFMATLRNGEFSYMNKAG